MARFLELLNRGVNVQLAVHTVTRVSLQLLNQAQTDLFMPQCPYAHVAAAAHQGLPGIFTMHSDDPDYWFIAEALTPATHGGSSVCVSQFLAHQLPQRLPASNPQVIPLRHHPANGPGQLLGSAVPRGGQPAWWSARSASIRCCTLSSTPFAPPARSKPARAACEQLVHQAGFANRIHSHGRVPPEQVQPLLQAARRSC